jgi:hypothetical protein
MYRRRRPGFSATVAKRRLQLHGADLMEWAPPFTGVRLLSKSEWAILPAYALEAAMKITTVGLDLAKNVFVRPESRLSLCFTGVISR